jgi:hypothetical protein
MLRALLARLDFRPPLYVALRALGQDRRKAFRNTIRVTLRGKVHLSHLTCEQPSKDRTEQLHTTEDGRRVA